MTGQDDASADALRARRALDDWAADADVAIEESSGMVVVSLPGEKKLSTTAAVKIGRYTVRVLAFVVRHPDERRADVHEWLLLRNGRLHGLAFMIDTLGDIYLVGEVPVAAFDVDTCDKLMGHVLETADESFNELLTLGFLSSMKREWQWRVSRGESTRNLQAFAHLLSEE